MKRETMSSKERVTKTYNFERPDRFPIDFCACIVIYDELRDKLKCTDDLELMDTFHVDFRWARPVWIGPELIASNGEPTDYFGVPRKGVGDFGNATGHPLSHLKSEDDIKSYSWPEIDYFDYNVYAEECDKYEEYAVLGGGWSWFFDAACDLVGMDKFLMMLHDNPELAYKLLERITDFFYNISNRMFETAADKTDIFFTGDDYGAQHAPLISLEMWRKLVKPHIKRLYGLAKSYDLKIMQHSCGSVSCFISDLIECGLDIIEPVQVRASGMSPDELVRTYGGKLCFHGGIDTQQTLPFGTPDDVRREVRERIETFRPYGGYTISPTQHLMPEIPLDNIVAMYESAYEYGWQD